MQRLCGATSELDDLDPWDALSTWLRQLGAYMVTKQALAAELMNYADRNAPLFTASRSTLLDAGGPLLDRAQAAGDVPRTLTSSR